MQDLGCNLDRCFLCRHTSPEWKDLIALKKNTLFFKKGRTIIEEGELVKGIFFINEGAVKVSKSWGEQKELIIRFAKSGDVLGHRGFGGDLHYPISATALEDTKVCFIDNAFLAASMAANATLSQQFVQLYATELQRAEKRMRDLAHMDVKGRIVLALFEIADVFGIGEGDFIALPVTRQDIASHAGTTYETVFKFFTELSGKNILTTSGKNIKLNDRKALQAFLLEEPVTKK
jgi:CRP/FNR family transcriptional regulator